MLPLQTWKHKRGGQNQAFSGLCLGRVCVKHEDSAMGILDYFKQKLVLKKKKYTYTHMGIIYLSLCAYTYTQNKIDNRKESNNLMPIAFISLKHSSYFWFIALCKTFRITGSPSLGFSQVLVWTSGECGWRPLPSRAGRGCEGRCLGDASLERWQATELPETIRMIRC